MSYLSEEISKKQCFAFNMWPKVSCTLLPPVSGSGDVTHTRTVLEAFVPIYVHQMAEDRFEQSDT